MATASVHIVNPPDITIAVATTSATCSNVCDGTASSTVSGGTPGYTYNWLPGGATTTNVNSLCPGDYTLTVTDVKGCVKTQTTTIISPPVLVLSATGSSVSCAGTCDGVGAATVSGGTPGYTYTWSPGNPTGQGTANISNLCVGTYTVIAADVNGCSLTTTISVDPPVPVAMTATVTNLTCNGGCNGVINATPSGGTGPYTYLLMPGSLSAGPTFNGLCAGTYSLTVTDSKGCSITSTYTLTQPTAITVNVSATAISCFNVCDATISSTVSGGTPGYTYSWSPGGQTTSTIAGQCAGDYTLSVSDANACVGTASIHVVNPPDITAAVSTTSATCSNVCDGTASATVSGGTPGYTYNWLPGGAGTATVNSLCPGDYTLTITDTKGCVKTQTATITSPPALVLDVTGSSVSCASACDGVGTATVSGGTPGYTYTWSPGNPTGQGTSAISNLCVGDYTVVVADANGCTLSNTITVSPPTPIADNVTPVNPSCNGGCNGSVTAAPTGGTGPYTYLLMPGGLTTGPVFNGLCAGTYSLTVTDSKGCSTTSTYTLTQPTPIDITLNATPLACFSDCNSTITSTVSGGSPGYTYSWMPGATTTSSLTNQCVGDYTLTVTDANACVNTATVHVASPPDITISTSTVAPRCRTTCDGSATAVVSGGTPGYTYSWSPSGGTGATANSLCAGSYTLTVTDNNGCVKTATVTITPPSALTLTPISTDLSCSGLCDGTASVSVAGGTPAYSYTWNPGNPTGQGTPAISGLCVGSYTVWVADANNCRLLATATVNPPTAVAVNGTATNLSCNAACNGSIVATPTGGTGPYTYTLMPGNITTTPPYTGLCAGTYTLTVTDFKGCSAIESYTLTEPNALGVTLSTTPISCFNQCNGTLSSLISGGYSGLYLYLVAGQPNQCFVDQSMCWCVHFNC